MTGIFSSAAPSRHVVFKNDAEVELIREACLLVCKTLAHVASMLKPGVTGMEIDRAAETFIRDHKARPAFKGYNGTFPGSLCVSYNDIVVHGIPSDRPFTETDIVSVDCGVELNGFYGDAAFSFAFTQVKEPVLELMRVTYASLYRGIEQAVSGKRVGDISFAIQDYCERHHGYGVVRELVGHGIGRSLHEEPEVPNYGKRGKGPALHSGMTIAIEPMINMGKRDVYQAADKWTIITKDHQPSAHYEHTVCVRKEKADILSDHRPILEAVKNNSELLEISPKS